MKMAEKFQPKKHFTRIKHAKMLINNMLAGLISPDVVSSFLKRLINVTSIYVVNVAHEYFCPQMNSRIRYQCVPLFVRTFLEYVTTLKTSGNVLVVRKNNFSLGHHSKQMSMTDATQKMCVRQA